MDSRASEWACVGRGCVSGVEHLAKVLDRVGQEGSSGYTRIGYCKMMQHMCVFCLICA